MYIVLFSLLNQDMFFNSKVVND